MKIPKRSLMFLTMIVFTTLLISMATVYGGKQDQEYLADSELFRQADSFIQKGDLHKAETLLSQLLEKYPQNVAVIFPYSWCLAQEGKYDEAISYLTKAQKQRPFLLENQMFLETFGEVLYKKGQYPRAKQYLIRAVQYKNGNNLLSQKAQSLLDDLEKKDKVTK